MKRISKIATLQRPRIVPPSGRPRILERRIDGDGLPTVATSNKVDPLGLKYLAVAPPGWGKTEFFMAFPDSLLLACEEGHGFVSGFKIVIDCYDYKTKGAKIEPWKDENGNMHMSFIEAVERIEASDRFRFIVIDTLDALVKMILDFHVESKHVEHISDMGDYGKGYDIGQNSPFRRCINRILKSGRGIGMTTHQEIVDAQFKAGKRSKKMTTLPKGIWKQVIPQVDLVLHGEFGGRRKPNKFKDRIVVTEGDEDTLAKNRGGILPPRFILPFKGRWEQFKGFFDDKKNIDKAIKEYDALYE